MDVRPLLSAMAVAALALLSACGEHADLPLAATTGPAPALVSPKTSGLFPTLNIAPARGWSEGATPVAARGLRVSEFARDLQHPRSLLVLPNGDVLVAESNAPANRPDDSPGLRGFVQKLIVERAGAGVPSANRISLLHDDGSGRIARSTLLQGLNSPFGMVLVGQDLYVADTDALLRFHYVPGQPMIGPGEKVTDLPAGRIDHHWTKNVVASPDGRHLYVSVGSNSNAGEHGIEAEAERAAVWEVDPTTGGHVVFASGLRNPVGMSWDPATGALWAAVNERDELGSDLVPDYMTALKRGAFYGWPYSYYGQHVDARVQPPRPDLVATAVPPDYALGAHTASLGLAFARVGLPPPFEEGAFVGQHGSWNRRPLSGYRVVFVPFSDGHPSGGLIDVLTGFVDADGHALGRPVEVAIDREGALLVADDVGNRVWRVTADH